MEITQEYIRGSILALCLLLILCLVILDTLRRK